METLDTRTRVQQKLDKAGQSHVLKHFEQLTDHQKETLLQEIDSIDLECVA
jgi:hypothetical protein